MDTVIKKAAFKNTLLVIAVIVLNISLGIKPLTIAFSLFFFLLVIAGDAWIIFPLVRKKEEIARALVDLARGGKDLTKKIELYGKDEMSELSRLFNDLVARFHSLIGMSLNTANQISSASADLSKVAKNMAVGADEQSVQLSGLAASMSQLSAAVNEVAKNTQTVAAAAKNASCIAERGGKTVESGLEGIKKVIASAENSAHLITELWKNAEAIGQIVSLIKDIADQTNLLALNAAIEAARAGETGRGFAVVADEVRKLAERTSKATQEISSVIQTLQARTNDAAQAMEQGVREAHEAEEFSRKITSILEEIISASGRVSDTIQQIATAVEEQSATTVEMSGNVEKISRLTEETAKNAKKTSDATVAVTGLSNKLLQETGVFKLNVFGVVPLENAVAMNKKFMPLVGYLNKTLERNYIIKVGKDYGEAIDDLGTGLVQISYQTPTTYIEGKHKYGTQLLGYFEKDGAPTYKSAIVVSRASGIKSLAELKGKRVCFGSEKSTGATLVPQAMLAEAGITLRDLSHYAYLGGHDVVARAILKGDYDAGGMMDSVVSEFGDKGLVAIKVSAPIPQFPICVNKDLDPDLVLKIKNALLSISDTAVIKAIDKGYTRFLEAKDSDFDGIRAMVKRLYGVEYK